MFPRPRPSQLPRSKRSCFCSSSRSSMTRARYRISSKLARPRSPGASRLISVSETGSSLSTWRSTPHSLIRAPLPQYLGTPPSGALVPLHLVQELGTGGTRVRFALGPLRRYRGFEEFLRKFLVLILLLMPLAQALILRLAISMCGRPFGNALGLALVSLHPPP